MEQTETIPTREEQIAALGPLPEAIRYVYNRTNGPWEGMFNGRVYVFASHEIKSLSTEVAEHLTAHSIIPGTLRHAKHGGGTLSAERALALGPGWTITGSVKVEDEFHLQYGVAEADATFLVPTETQPGPEYFDRASIPNYVDRPNMRDPGKPSHPELLRV
jgi:hypothetical protein